MKEIALDTSTLILLAKIDLLESLVNHANIVISEIVREEALRKPELLDAQIIFRFIKNGKIKVVKEKESLLGAAIQKDFFLGKGEASVLSLAKSKGILLGIDDQQGIKACKVLGVKFTTTLAFVVRFFEKKLLDKDQTMAKLEKLQKYGWYRTEVLEKIFREIEGGYKQ